MSSPSARPPRHSPLVPRDEKQHWAAWPGRTGKGKQGNGKGARPSVAFKDGATILTRPDLGHLPAVCASQGVWTSVIQGSRLASLSEPSSTLRKFPEDTDKPFLS